MASLYVISAFNEISTCHRFRGFLLPEIVCLAAAWTLHIPSRPARGIALTATALLLGVGGWLYYEQGCHSVSHWV